MAICEGLPKFSKYCGCIPLREGAIIASVINSVITFALTLLFAYLALLVEHYNAIEKSVFGLLTSTCLIGFMCYLLLLMGVIKHNLDESYFWITAILLLSQFAGAVASCFLIRPLLSAVGWIVTGITLHSWLCILSYSHKISKSRGGVRNVPLDDYYSDSESTGKRAIKTNLIFDMNNKKDDLSPTNVP